ncbi:MAG: chitobiase/beta-hexosaminidase C-terminal domain-containing protein [Prevotella sp.]|jgi:hypothetical protein|nr:chitobiase/beta-hexosaminidase C-terminal domain-containing protein [Prevotella sp.]
MKLILKTGSVLLALALTVGANAAGSKKIVISEFLASNSTGLTDEDGDYSDWIELYNPSGGAINLNNWILTDTENAIKWRFPNVSIDAGRYLVVFASGKARNNPVGELHTNFSLSKDGEYLAILEADGSVSDEYAPSYPPQETDVSYGYWQGEAAYFEIPTPGSENTLETKAGVPVFSVGRGYFDEPFTVALSASKPDTKIYYTTDGTRPTEQSTLYSAPVPIAKTTPLSAVGLKDGKYSPIVTNTYFFVSDIITQPNNPAGYPDRWGYLGSDIKYDNYAVGERAPADYAMDATVCNNPLYKNLLKDAFLSIPSLCIVTTPGYLFSDTADENEGGIYIYTGVTTGDGWERPVSIEYFEPETERQFQINCGLRLHGAASRQPEKSGKHSFRVIFRKTYGEGKLKFDLFEDTTAVTEFDHLVFRAGYNQSWLHSTSSERTNTQYTNDSFAKRTQRNMGHVSGHDRFVHLFINGLYWGVYNLTERVGNKFMAAYFGGEDADYDVVNHDGLADGDYTAFQSMVDLAKAGKYDQLLAEDLLCMENYIDYMLLNFYIGNTDWPHNNWYAARNRLSPGDGFRFFSWDAESSLADVNLNRITGISGDLRRILFGSSSSFSASGGGMYNNKEFQVLLADRIHKHFFNDGALSPAKTAELYEKIANEIDLAVILESARWGDYRKNTLTPKGSSAPLYTRNEHWLPRKEKLLRDYFPKRTDIVYKHLQDMGLTSPISPPTFSSYSGNVDSPFALSMSAVTGTVYYTSNGTDPREYGGDVADAASVYAAPLQIAGACTIKARAKNGQTWSALTEAAFTSEHSALFQVAAADRPRVYAQDHTLCIVLPVGGAVRFELYSLSGTCVRQALIDGRAGTNHVGLSELPAGAYIYKVSFNGTVYQGKLVK